MRRSLFLIIGLWLVLTVTGMESLSADAVNDNFTATRRLESGYFVILAEDGVNLGMLGHRLEVPYSIETLIREPVDTTEHPFLQECDSLYLAVAEIMGIRLKRFNVTVKICRDGERLSQIAQKLFGQAMGTGGFYVATLDTIYMDASTVTLNVFGHELAHAVLSDYFVVLPPTKIQEVLCGYVEYELRKYTHTLPISR